MENINFRSAFRGFNREDVVHYIEFLNQQHAAQIAQLNSQLEIARENACSADMRKQLDEINDRCAELESALNKQDTAAEELEAYRRAERAERVAQEKADLIYNKANAVLAEASLKADTASADLAGAAEQFSAQLTAYQASIQAAKTALEEATAALYAIRPEE